MDRDEDSRDLRRKTNSKTELDVNKKQVRHVPGEKRGYRPRQLLQEARQDTMRAKSSSPLVPTPEEDDMSGKSARFGSGSPIQRKPLPVHEPKPNLQASMQLKYPIKRFGTHVRDSLKNMDDVSPVFAESEELNSEEIEKIQVKPSPKQDKKIKNSPAPHLRKRPGSLDLGKQVSRRCSSTTSSDAKRSSTSSGEKDRSKKSSNSSITPSTESSQSGISARQWDLSTKDQVLQQALEEEDNFLKFVESLEFEKDPICKYIEETQQELSPTKLEESVPTKQIGNTRVGLDHLDGLCKLMEELSQLKDQNLHLQKRLTFLEAGMEEHGISDPGKRFPHFDPLKRSGDLKGIKGEERRGKNEEILGREEENIELRKEKIEGRGKILPWNKQEDDYSFKNLSDMYLTSSILQSSSSSSSASLPLEAYNFSVSTPGLNVLRSSSVTDCVRGEGWDTREGPRRHSLTSLRDSMVHQEIEKKRTKSTWCKVKKMISTRRESLKKKQKFETDTIGNSFESECEVDDLFCTKPMERFTVQENLPNVKKVRGKPPDIILKRDLEKTLNSPHQVTGGAGVFREHRPETRTDHNKFKWSNVKNAFLAPPARRADDDVSQSLPSSPNSYRGPNGIVSKDTSRISPVFVYDDQIIQQIEGSNSENSNETLNISSEILKNYEKLQRSLSDEFHRKMSDWERKKTWRENLGMSFDETNLSADFRKKLDEWEKIKRSVEGGELTGQRQEPPDNRKQEKKGGVKTNPQDTHQKIRARPVQQHKIQEDDLKPEFKLKVAEWEVRKVLAGHSTKTAAEITKLMPDDFNKKLREWEEIKEKENTLGEKTTRLERNRSGNDKVKKRRRHQERLDVGTFAWLDRELVKVEREKQRLEKEREKYKEREVRLLSMREALSQDAHQGDQITVKTSKGEEFRFAGLSDTFTKKLYEWENSREIRPELSTITLLKSVRNKQEDTGSVSPHQGGIVQRSKSESSLGDILLEGDSTNKTDDSRKSSPEISITDEENPRRGVVRTDSVKTQSGLRLLEEKMNLLAHLQDQEDRKREIESKLESIGDQMSHVEKSRYKLTQIKKEEGLTAEYSNQQLLNHLNRKLGYLEKEHTELMDASLNLKASLSDQKEAQDSITQKLINKIDAFNATKLGSSPDTNISSLRNIQKLSNQLENHAKNLQCLLHKVSENCGTIENQDLDTKTEVNSSEIQLELFTTLALLREELLNLATTQGFDTKCVLEESKAGLKTTLLHSEEDLRYGSSRADSYNCSHDSRLASLASSTNSVYNPSTSHSMSIYGSETALDLYNKAEQLEVSLLLGGKTDNALLNEDIYDEEDDELPVLVTVQRKGSLSASEDGKRLSKISRRVSSDNISTPASNCSRSPSLQSTDEEEANGLVQFVPIHHFPIQPSSIHPSPIQPTPIQPFPIQPSQPSPTTPFILTSGEILPTSVFPSTPYIDASLAKTGTDSSAQDWKREFEPREKSEIEKVQELVSALQKTDLENYKRRIEQSKGNKTEKEVENLQITKEQKVFDLEKLCVPTVKTTISAPTKQVEIKTRNLMGVLVPIESKNVNSREGTSQNEGSQITVSTDLSKDLQKDFSVGKCQNAEEIKIELAPTKRPTQLPAVKDFPKTSQIKPKSARGTLNPGLINLTKKQTAREEFLFSGPGNLLGNSSPPVNQTIQLIQSNQPSQSNQSNQSNQPNKPLLTNQSKTKLEKKPVLSINAFGSTNQTKNIQDNPVLNSVISLSKSSVKPNPAEESNINIFSKSLSDTAVNRKLYTAEPQVKMEETNPGIPIKKSTNKVTNIFKRIPTSLSESNIKLREQSSLVAHRANREIFEKEVAQEGGRSLDEQIGGLPEGLEGEHDNENLVCGELHIRFGTKKSNSRTQLEKSKSDDSVGTKSAKIAKSSLFNKFRGNQVTRKESNHRSLSSSGSGVINHGIPRKGYSAIC